jgi:hypothetical protein
LKELQSNNKHSSLPIHSTCQSMVQHHQQGLLCSYTVHAMQWYSTTSKGAAAKKILQPVYVL